MNKYKWSLLVFPIVFFLAAFVMWDFDPGNWLGEVRAFITVVGLSAYVLTVTFPGWDD